MITNPDGQHSHPLEYMDSSDQNRRLQTIAELGLLDAESVPVFEEATQTAAHFLEAPICVLGILDRDRQWYKSAVGLSRIGLMNSLASSRQLPRNEAFCTTVVEQQRVLIITDAAADPAIADSVLVKRYGIHAYLGVPLMASNGTCVGTLAVMSLAARTFSHKEIDFLQLMARWSMSEYERDRLLKRPSQTSTDLLSAATNSAAIPVKANLIAQMTQELCTPLTSILGMGSVLSQGIYGPLTEKQREYIEIIHNSGQYLLSLVNEIVELGALDDSNPSLNLTPVDIEMLCQQSISTLSQAAERREQQIQLSVEPGSRIWLLDKDKVRQLLYHLVFSVIQSSSAGGTIRIHVSRKQADLNLTVWISHPWLGDGLPQVEMAYSQARLAAVGAESNGHGHSMWAADESDNGLYFEHHGGTELSGTPKQTGSRQSLGLMLSRQLAELHGGSIMVRGSGEDGYRYVVRLPQIRGVERAS